MTNAQLEREFRHELLRYKLLMGGNAQVIDGRGSANYEDKILADVDKPVRLDPDPWSYEKRWEDCTSFRARSVLVRELRMKILHHKIAPSMQAEFVRGTREWKTAIASDARPAEVVARSFAVSRRTVFNYRREVRILQGL